MHSIMDFNLQPSSRNTKKKNRDRCKGENEAQDPGRRGSANSAEKRRSSDSGMNSSGDSRSEERSSSSSNSSDGPPPLIAAELVDNFTIHVDGEVIILDDVTKQNEDGWTPLHACCHSNTTAKIGLKILKEMIALGGNLNLKTTRGPGGFNSGFTPLHMASAYGVADLVDALLNAGADPNCRNSFDWTPLLEVCHRGFAGLVTSLVKAGAETSHIPDQGACSGAHIMRGAPQSALGEAARGGFKTICKFLLASGSDKDQRNHLGWTPLHEACYFNHLDTVQLLLVHGADPLVKNVQGAMPYNMSNLQAIRDLLREIGGDEAAKVMPTPTFSVCVNEEGQMFVRVTAGKSEEESDKRSDGKEERKTSGDGGKSSSPSRTRTRSPTRDRNSLAATARGSKGTAGGADGKGALHSGGVLGDLPALGRPSAQRGTEAKDNQDQQNRSSPHRPRRQRASSTQGHDSDIEPRTSWGGSGSSNSSVNPHENALRMPGETNEGKAPAGIICQLSKRVVRDPVRTPYGHLFDRQMIGLWLSKQGSICPLTGQPLVDAELKPDEKAKKELKAWMAEKRKSSTRAKSSGTTTSATTTTTTVTTTTTTTRKRETTTNAHTTTAAEEGKAAASTTREDGDHTEVRSTKEQEDSSPSRIASDKTPSWRPITSNNTMISEDEEQESAPLPRRQAAVRDEQRARDGERSISTTHRGVVDASNTASSCGGVNHRRQARGKNTGESKESLERGNDVGEDDIYEF